MEKSCGTCMHRGRIGCKNPVKCVGYSNWELKDGVMPTELKDSGDRTKFDTGAVRDMHSGKGRYDLLPWDAIHELAIHCEQGALKYGERNCEKGIPIHSLIDSAIRHLSCYLRGMKDEPHLRAAMWNIAFAIWMEKNKPEMQDIPMRKEADKSGLSPCKRYEVRCIGIDKDANFLTVTNGNEGECTGEIGNCGCIHAEELLLRRMPQPIAVVVSISPCINCADKLIRAGVKSVSYVKEYRLRDGIDLLVRAGVKVTNLSEGVGV